MQHPMENRVERRLRTLPGSMKADSLIVGLDPGSLVPEVLAADDVEDVLAELVDVFQLRYLIDLDMAVDSRQRLASDLP